MIAFYRSSSEGDGVYIMPSLGGSERKLTNTWANRFSFGSHTWLHWSSDGKELFFFDGTSIVAVPVTGGPALVPGRHGRLFDASRFSERLGPVYDVSNDSRRFLFLRAAGPQGATRRTDLRVIENWTLTLMGK